ncbi:MAG: EAL domain-containing protein [Chromatiales bacterium]|nr:EAL domain-containing protein [Chromatiales bacterium]
MLPPLFGLSFLVFLETFTFDEIARVVRGSGFGFLAVGTLLFALWYFNRFALPWLAYLRLPDQNNTERALIQLRRFAYHYWGLFTLTMGVRPTYMMLSAEHLLGSETVAADWFRVHLVLLLVFILFGLPFYILISDLLGQLLGGIKLERPQLSVKAKIFLIGSLIPLLIDTALVLFFWSRTGYFSGDTILFWLMLEGLAIAGTLLFVRSITQSLSPLQSLIRQQPRLNELELASLRGVSTDELGILANEYRQLLQHHMALTARLRKSEEWLSNILENMQDTFYRTDLQGRILYITPMVERVLGYRPDELVGTRMADLYLEPSARERFLADLEANHGAVRNYTSALRHRNGSTVWASTNAHYYLDEEGALAGVEGNSRDITVLKLAEQALQQEQQRLLATLESITDAVITTDTSGVIDYLNPVAERLLSRGESVTGFHYISVLPLYDEVNEKELDDLVKLCLSHQGSFVNANNAVFRREDGREFVLKVSASSMLGSDGKLSGAVLVLHDITESMKMTRQLNYLAAHDPLTGLVNRREFEHRLAQAIHTAEGQSKGHVLLYLDLDQFKVVNDTCGHRAGDELLKQVGLLLESRLRESDVLARLGGDEFAVLLEHCPLEKAQQQADALRQMVKEFRFVWEEKSFEIGISIGLVPIYSSEQSMGELLSAADAACYFAKEQGRNRVYTYHGDHATLERHGEMSWVHRITEAFEAERFRLDAQYIAPLQQSGGLPHYEVLLRMVSEEGHIVPPMAFIPAAERYNLMPTIDRWVIRTTFAQLCHAREESGRVPIGVSINLSGQSLADDYFLEFVVAQLENADIDPSQICFEITETAAITNLSRAMMLFSELRKRGCSFSLDDFGSGLSSYGYLKTLPVDYLKIDGAFVKDILEDPIDETMVEAIHKVGHVMELQTIAEFVESEAIATRLREMGVDFAQGYAISPPEPLDVVLARHNN